MKDITSKNYYELLGVEREATKEQIKEAYKSIALVYHPDSNFFSEIIDDKPEAEQSDVFKQLTAAYNTLIDSAKRVAYDESLPPVLPGWDSEKPDIIGKKITTYSPANRNNCGATSAAFGVFGSEHPDIYDDYEDDLDDVVDPTITDSVSNLIFRQKQNFWTKILGIFSTAR